MKQMPELKKIIAVFFCLVIALPLAGCYDQREIDEMAYPLAMGLDVGVADTLRLTLQIASPLSIGGGGGGQSGGGGGGTGGGKGGPTSIITVDTPSMYSGLNLINNIVSKEINMSHTKMIIFSRKLAEKGISNYMHALQRGREFRPDVYIAVSDDPPDQYLKAVQPILESNPAKYYELMLGKDFTSFYPTVRLNMFYYKNESDAIEPVAIYTALNKHKSMDDIKPVQSKITTDEIRLEGHYIAGDIPLSADQKNEFMGIAVFKNGKMVGTMNGRESSYMQMLVGEYKYAYWTMPDVYEKDKLVVLQVFQRKKPSIIAKINYGKPSFRIGLDLEADFTSIQSDVNYENNPEIIEKYVADLLKKEILSMLKKTTDVFNSDIGGFGRYIKSKFLTWDEWKKYDWPDQYKYSSFDVNVKFKMRRTGLMIKSIEH